MEHLQKLFDKQIPTHLYHYTNGNRFLGIIQKTEMWASHIRFMNDLKEEVYALELFGKTFTRFIKNNFVKS